MSHLSHTEAKECMYKHLSVSNMIVLWFVFTLKMNSFVMQGILNINNTPLTRIKIAKHKLIL